MLQSLRTRHLSQLRSNPWYSTWFVVMNTRLAPFDNVLARRALNYALDRAHLRDLALGQGSGQVTCQVLPPDIDGFRPYCPYTVAPDASGTWTGPDLARARELVRRSGTAGRRITFVQPKWIEFSPAAGRYVVSVLDSIGYRARLVVGADPYRKPGAAQHIQVGFYAWGPLYAAPAGFIPPGLSCAAAWNDGNTSRFCDPAIDREMARAEALQTSDPVEATNLWASVDRRLTDAAPWAPFANGVVLEVVSKRVGNYQYNPQWGTLLGQLWVR
jgi:peptide/nickel transport system substrate-binding protein